MSDNSDIMKMVPIVHKDDRSLELAQVLGLSLKEWLAALKMKTLVSQAEHWENKRSPHALMVDCIHIIGMNNKSKKVTQNNILEVSKALWGMSTMPRSNTWKPHFLSIVQGVLDELYTNSKMESQDENLDIE